MTGIDWLIVALTLLLALYGYLQGFIVGVLSLGGFALGAFIGTRVGPLLLPNGSHSQYAPLFGLLGAVLAGGVLASGFEGVGVRARSVLRLPGLRQLDGLLGAALTACVGLGIAWIVGAVALESASSPSLRTSLERSKILRGLDELLPPSGAILHALARIDPLPSVTGPEANVPPPNRAVLSSPGARSARPSVVRVLGTACGVGIEGTGWVAAPGLVVTNAHVVAGENDTVIQVDGQPPDVNAQVVEFDPHDDVAVLRVNGLRLRPLALAPRPSSGRAGAILGYPQDGPFRAEPGRIGQTESVHTEDAYGTGQVVRSVTALRGRIEPGNSGGPIVDGSGRVLATVFAAITSGSAPGGFAVPNALVRSQLSKAQGHGVPVPTGHCAG